MRQDFIRLKAMEAMQDKDITTGDIAKVLGTSGGHASNILLGRSGTSEERWRIICTAVGVDLDAIIQAEMSGRLPGLREVETAWAALRSGEPYTRLEILAEAPTVAADEATSPPGGNSLRQPLTQLTPPPEEEAIEALPLYFAPGELGMLLEGLKLALHDAMSTYPERPDNILDIRHIHHLTGLMLRLTETLEEGDGHA